MNYPTRADIVAGANDPMFPDTWHQAGRALWNAFLEEHDAEGGHRAVANLVGCEFGGYVGDGAAARVIPLASGLTPVYVELYADTSAAPLIASAQMSGGASKPFANAATVTSGILALSPGALTVGAHAAANQIGGHYWYVAYGTLPPTYPPDCDADIPWIQHGEEIAISDPPAPLTDPPLRPAAHILTAVTTAHAETGAHLAPAFAANLQLQTGSYLGTGAARTLTFGAIRSLYKLLIWRDGAYAPVLKTYAMPAAAAKACGATATALQTGMITAISANTATLDASAQINEAGATYYYAAWGKPDAPALTLVVRASDNTVMNYRRVNLAPDLTAVAAIFGGVASDYREVAAPPDEVQQAIDADYITYNGSAFAYVMRTVTVSGATLSVNVTWDRASYQTIPAFSQTFASMTDVNGWSCGYYIHVGLYRDTTTGVSSYQNVTWSNAVTGIPASKNTTVSGKTYISSLWQGLLCYQSSAWSIMAEASPQNIFGYGYLAPVPNQAARVVDIDLWRTVDNIQISPPVRWTKTYLSYNGDCDYCFDLYVCMNATTKAISIYETRYWNSPHYAQYILESNYDSGGYCYSPSVTEYPVAPSGVAYTRIPRVHFLMVSGDGSYRGLFFITA